MEKKRSIGKSPTFIIFTTVLVDLIGFGMVIPLVGLYGRHFGASGFSLSVLGAIYSTMQFFFAPFWGALSDRIGRRPIILLSLLGSTLAYVFFAMAPSFEWLLLSRAFGGIFAANISAAQAYIADVTPPEDRAKGMGLIGAAFGIGFTLGPPLGGIAAAHLGLSAPGWIAASICGLNLLLAIIRLPESLPRELRSKKTRSLAPLSLAGIRRARATPELAFLLALFFLVTFAFSNMEQTISLLFQSKFDLDTGRAGYQTGLILMASGILGAFVQGGLIRRLVPRFGERKLLVIGLGLNLLTMLSFPYCPVFWGYFLLSAPLAFGSSLINPSVSSLISKSADATEQGSTLGLSQGLGSLARALGPFCGLYLFQLQPATPYWLAGAIAIFLAAGAIQRGYLQTSSRLAESPGRAR